MTHPFRLTLLAVLALAWMTPSAASAEGQGPLESWLPAEVGNRWSYVYTRERRRLTEGAEESVETVRGTRVDQVMARATGIAPDAVELRSTIRGRADEAAAETVENRRVVLSSKGAGFRIHLREAPNPLTGEAQVFRFDPPFDGMRPDARRAEPWTSGVEESGGLRTEYQTEVLGIQDARTPAGLYEKCLVLRTRGRMSGSVDVYGESVAVDEGHVVLTEWYAPGVGRVLAKTEVEQKLRMADGSAIELTEKSQYALGAVELASAPGPAEPPAAPTAAPASAATAPAAPDGEPHPPAAPNGPADADVRSDAPAAEPDPSAVVTPSIPEVDLARP